MLYLRAMDDAVCLTVLRYDGIMQHFWGGKGGGGGNSEAFAAGYNPPPRHGGIYVVLGVGFGFHSGSMRPWYTTPRARGGIARKSCTWCNVVDGDKNKLGEDIFGQAELSPNHC